MSGSWEERRGKKAGGRGVTAIRRIGKEARSSRYERNGTGWLLLSAMGHWRCGGI